MMIFTLGKRLASVMVAGMPVGSDCTQIEKPLSPTSSQTGNDLGSASELGSTSLVLPPVKMRKPVKPRSIQCWAFSTLSGASMSIEPTPVKRAGKRASESAKYEQL